MCLLEWAALICVCVCVCVPLTFYLGMKRGNVAVCVSRLMGTPPSGCPPARGMRTRLVHLSGFPPCLCYTWKRSVVACCVLGLSDPQQVTQPLTLTTAQGRGAERSSVWLSVCPPSPSPNPAAQPQHLWTSLPSLTAYPQCTAVQFRTSAQQLMLWSTEITAAEIQWCFCTIVQHPRPPPEI